MSLPVVENVVECRPVFHNAVPIFGQQPFHILLRVSRQVHARVLFWSFEEVKPVDVVILSHYQPQHAVEGMHLVNLAFFEVICPG